MPEKTVQDVPRVIRELYEKGTAALMKQNYGYAISIFNQVLEKEPGFYACREALRAAQFKKSGGGGGFFKKVLGTASSSPGLAKGQLALRNNPVEALSLAEQILNNDPTSSAAHKLLAEAALAVDFPRTAVLSLEIARKNSPRDRQVNLALGAALARAGESKKAEAVYNELLRQNPADNQAAQALKNLFARRTMSEGGYEELADGQGSYRDILRNKEEAISLEQQNRHVKTGEVAERLLNEYIERLRENPDDVTLIRKAAELCVENRDYDQALEFYARLVAVQGINDPSLERAISDISARKYEQATQSLDPNAPDYAEKAAALQEEQQTFLLTAMKKRSEKYPNDLQIKFELGQLYFQAGKISEAIQEFQKAQANQHRRVQALTYLGKCFALRGLPDVAARTLQNAINEKAVFDAEKKELIYSLGTVLEQMGKAEQAIEQFKQIYEVDIGYKDVARKVDQYYAGKLG